MGSWPNNCCCCVDGAVIPRWLNQTRVRQPGAAADRTLTSDPFARNDTVQYAIDHSPATCSSLPLGSCGPWLKNGDKNGLSMQTVYDTIEDIIACAVADETHLTNDHNCYVKSGTVDMTDARKRGMKGVGARKFWHGRGSFFSKDCLNDPSQPADQVRYLGQRMVFSLSESGTQHLLDNGDWVNPPTPTVALEFTATYSYGKNYTSDAVVDRHSGVTSLREFISSCGGSGSLTTNTGNFDYGGLSREVYYGPPVTVPYNINCAGSAIPVHTTYFYDGADRDVTYLGALGDSGTALNAHATFLTSDICDGKIFFPDNSTNAWLVSRLANNPCTVGELNDALASIVAASTGLTLIPFALTETSFTGGLQWDVDLSYSSYGPIYHGEFTVSVTLDTPYTAAECLADFYGALAAWDLSDGQLAKWRRDELLGCMPWIFYDEGGGPTTPPGTSFNGTMDDYTQPRNGDGTWPQRAWLDPGNYVWKSPTGGLNPLSDAGGNVLITPIRTGEIIAHNVAGSARHWWPAYINYVRVYDEETAIYTWVIKNSIDATGFEIGGGGIGGYTYSVLPEVTLRWKSKLDAQHDAIGGHDAAGVFPTAYLHQKGGVLEGVKVVEVSQPWLSTNYGRPCGPDKYAVQQDTVCCIASKAGSTFTVKKTGNATAPLAAGGLTVNDYIAAEGDGIYRITAIATTSADPDGNPQWLVTVGSKLDDLPTDYAMGEDPDGANHLGTLRFPSASGICGRAAITAVESSGTVTITVAAQKYLRLNPVTGTILVDLYLTDMTGLVQPALTRVSDTSFTFSTSGLSVPTGGWSALVWMTGRGVDYTKFTDATRQTGIKLEWSFNPRQFAKESADGYPGPFTDWYAGIGGCLSGSITEFNYTTGNCRPVIGFVPYNSPLIGPGASLLETGVELISPAVPLENFRNQVLFAMPATFAFDDVYSAHWQGGIEMTMADPFYQEPFKPDCDASPTNSVQWAEDGGAGQVDYETTSGGGSTVQYRFFRYRPIVEAAANIPSGCSLPSGVNLLYDGTTDIAPPLYPNGCTIGDVVGNFASIWRPWGLSERACPNIQAVPRVGRWADYYAGFVPC